MDYYKTPTELEREQATRDRMLETYGPVPEPIPDSPVSYASEADRKRADATAAKERQFDAAREAGQLPIELYFAQRSEIHRKMGIRRTR